MEFFNAAEDEPSKLRQFLIGRIREIQKYHRDQLGEVIAGARALLENYEKEQAREAMREAARHLSVWLTHNAELGSPTRLRVRDSLVAATRTAHVKTIYASVIRDGDWPNLDYSHQLRSRRSPDCRQHGRTEGVGIPRDSDQHSKRWQIRRRARSSETGYPRARRRIRRTDPEDQLVGQSVYAAEMRSDLEFWRTCNQEWGRGRGYRDRVAKHNQDWFDRQDHDSGDKRVRRTCENRMGCLHGGAEGTAQVRLMPQACNLRRAYLPLAQVRRLARSLTACPSTFCVRAPVWPAHTALR